ncbi:MAG: hypothetical protein AAFW75_00280 [Cyanobacteria bacterium J06636_16]
MQKLLLAPLTAIWIVAIAILSVQNATPISVQFLAFRSVQLPFGVVLSFCVAGGMLITALLLALFGRRG